MSLELDRNTDRAGRGKYALVNMRKLIPIVDSVARFIPEDDKPPTQEQIDNYEITQAFELLLKSGIISLGNETPGDQFFVMKYKDKFTASGLMGYAHAAEREAALVQDADQCRDLLHYASVMRQESLKAKTLGNHIPD